MTITTRVSEGRLAELVRYHKERAIYWEQLSDGGKHPDTLAGATPHWELVDIIRELRERRKLMKECGPWLESCAQEMYWTEAARTDLNTLRTKLAAMGE